MDAAKTTNSNYIC